MSGLFLTGLVLLGACGRYLPPVPPEKVAPATIQFISGTGDGEGFTLTWKAPDTDAQGKKLKDIEGYRIYRTEMSNLRDRGEEKQELDFALLATVPDSHIDELRRLQADAEREGRIVRKVKIDEIKKQFSYKDKGVSTGKVYLFKVVPINNGGVEGVVQSLFRVTFNGPQSSVEQIAVSDATQDLTFDS